MRSAADRPLQNACCRQGSGTIIYGEDAIAMRRSRIPVEFVKAVVGGHVRESIRAWISRTDFIGGRSDGSG